MSGIKMTSGNRLNYRKHKSINYMSYLAGLIIVLRSSLCFLQNHTDRLHL